MYIYSTTVANALVPVYLHSHSYQPKLIDFTLRYVPDTCIYFSKIITVHHQDSPMNDVPQTERYSIPVFNMYVYLTTTGVSLT